MKSIEYHIITLDDQTSCTMISDWYLKEWRIPIETSLQKLSLCQTNNVPFQILMTIDNLPVATGGLYHHVGLHDHFPKYKQYPFWLALVYTLPEYRGKGCGSMLCEKIQTIVRDLGFDEMWLFTDTAESLYQRLGWQTMEHIALKHRNVAIMKKYLNSNINNNSNALNHDLQ
jgi:GNAT superfamily N-acetyltransferase